MLLTNNTTSDIMIYDIRNAAYAPAPTLVPASTTALVLTADAQHSVELAYHVAQGNITITSLAEPTTVGPVPVIITGTSASVAGERSTHTHALGYIPTDIKITVTAGNNNDANAGVVDFVSATATTLVVKANVESLAFTAKLA